MSTTPQTRSYPTAYFLHAPLSHPKTLQKVLGIPHLLKLRKASLTGYAGASNSTVVRKGYGFGERGEEPKIKGVVHYVSNEVEEKALLNFVCEKEGGVKVKEVEMEVGGGMWKGKEVVRGWVFEKVEGSEMAAELEVEVREELPAVMEEEDEMAVEEEADIQEPGAYEEHLGEDEMTVEDFEGISEPGEYDARFNNDEMEIEIDTTMELGDYDAPSTEDQTTPPSPIVSSPPPFPLETPSPGRPEGYQTTPSTPPPAPPQRADEEQNTNPRAGLAASTPRDEAKIAPKPPCDTPGPHIGSTIEQGSGTVKSLVALYEQLRL